MWGEWALFCFHLLSYFFPASFGKYVFIKITLKYILSQLPDNSNSNPNPKEIHWLLQIYLQMLVSTSKLCLFILWFHILRSCCNIILIVRNFHHHSYWNQIHIILNYNKTWTFRLSVNLSSSAFFHKAEQSNPWLVTTYKCSCNVSCNFKINRHFRILRFRYDRTILR